MADPKARVILEAVRRGEGAFRSFNRDLDRMATKAKLAGAAAAAAMVAITKSSFDSLDALGKMSDKLGIATEDIAALQVAAGLTGVANNQLELGLQRMTRRLAEISEKGTGTATPALKQLGLTIEDLEGLTADEQFRKIAEAMQGIPDQGARVLAAFGLFDSEGVNLVRTLDLVADSWDEVEAKTVQFGLAVSRLDIIKIEQANDALFLARQRVRGLGNLVAVEVAPIITGLSEAFFGVGADADEMGAKVREAMDFIVGGVGLVADSVFGWKLIFAATKIAALEMAEFMADKLADIHEVILEVGRAFKDAFTLDAEEVATSIERIEAQLAEMPDNVVTAERRARLERRLQGLRDLAADIVPGDQQEPVLFRQIQQSLADSSAEAVEAFNALNDAVLPSQRIRENVERWRADAEAAAQAGVNTRGPAPEAPTADPRETIEQETARLAAEAELAKELEAVRVFTSSREQIEREAIGKRAQTLRDGYAAGKIEFEDFQSQMIEVARKGAEALTEISTTGGDNQKLFGDLQTVEEFAASREQVEIAATERRLQILSDARERDLIDEARFNELSLAVQQKGHEALIEAIGTREQIEQLAIQRRLETLVAAREQELIDQQTFEEMSAEVARQGQERLTEIALEGMTERAKFEAMTAKQQVQHVLGSLQQMTAGVAQSNKAMFKINKLAAIADAVINTARGVTQALAAYPPPLSFAMAAVQAAAGAAQIQAIKATSFGGGTTPSVAGSVAVSGGEPVGIVPPVPQADSGRGQVLININVEGGVNGPDGFEGLMDLVEENLADRLENREAVLFTRESRQGSI